MGTSAWYESSSTAPGAWLPDTVGSSGVDGVKTKEINSLDVDFGEMDSTISASLPRDSASTSVEVCPDRLLLHEP